MYLAGLLFHTILLFSKSLNQPLSMISWNKKSMLLNIICCWVTSVISDSVRPHRRQPTRMPRPWDSPGKNTGVGCHCKLQFSSVQSLSCVRLFVIPWIAAARPPCPSPTPGVHSDSHPSSWWCHLILCCPLLLLPPIPPSTYFLVMHPMETAYLFYHSVFVKCLVCWLLSTCSPFFNTSSTAHYLSSHSFSA